MPEKMTPSPKNASKIAIASDHAGLTLKSEIQKRLQNFHWIDLGPNSIESVDYPDYAEKLGTELQKGTADLGILICGSGIGMCISANKMSGIRAALCENPTSAFLSRQHNDANVLCLGARFLAPEYATEIAERFLESPFSQNERHQKRIEKIAKLKSEAR